MYTGWTIRRQYELEHTRMIAAEIRNSAFGAKHTTRPGQLFELPEIDNYSRYEPTPQEFNEFLERMRIQAGLKEPIQLIKVAS